VTLLDKVLPPLQLIYEINRRFLARWPALARRRRPPARMSLVEEGQPSRSAWRTWHRRRHSVNGVAAITAGCADRTGADFYALTRRSSTTRPTASRSGLAAGGQPRPGPADQRRRRRRLGDRLDRLRAWSRSHRRGVPGAFLEVKRQNKEAPGEGHRRATGVAVEADSLFDVHVKRNPRVQAAAAQLLPSCMLLSVVEDGGCRRCRDVGVRGKAAPGYWAASRSSPGQRRGRLWSTNDPRARETCAWCSSRTTA